MWWKDGFVNSASGMDMNCFLRYLTHGCLPTTVHMAHARAAASSEYQPWVFSLCKWILLLHMQLAGGCLQIIYTHVSFSPIYTAFTVISRALLFLPFEIFGASLAGWAGIIPYSSVVATHRDSRKLELVAASHLSQTRFSLFGPLLIFTLNLQHGFIPGPQQCLPLQERQTYRAPTGFILCYNYLLVTGWESESLDLPERSPWLLYYISLCMLFSYSFWWWFEAFEVVQALEACF